MKIMTRVALGMLIASSCFLFFGSNLVAARLESKELEPLKTFDITEAVPAANVEKTTNAVATSTAKKKPVQAPKGVVYLPIVSVSSYVPLGVQIFLMLFAIAVSGLFGAWLMFRELAKQVQVLQENLPQPAHRPLVSENFAAQIDMGGPGPGVHQTMENRVKKRSLFVSKKNTAEREQQNLLKQQISEPSHQGYNPPNPGKRVKVGKKSDESKSNRMPKNLLINEWFPVER
jgi:hypothetical protein